MADGSVSSDGTLLYHPVPLLSGLAGQCVVELTILAMPTAYSISEGIAIGVISWTIINVISGKAKEKKISPLMYVLTVLFILKYVFL